MDKTVLKLDDLTVESFTTARDAEVIGVFPTGCIPDCAGSAITDCYCWADGLAPPMKRPAGGCESGGETVSWQRVA